MTYAGYDITEQDIAWAETLDVGTPINYSDINDKPTILQENPPSKWLRHENQGRHPSCVGNALAAVAEIAYFYATSGDIVQLSRWFAYIQSQKYSGSRFGEGDGAYIQGAVKAAKRVGVCLESTVPYPRSYHRKFPPKAIDEAAKYRMSTERRINSYDDLRLWHEAGIGAAIIGRPWGRGAHALAVIEMVPDKKDRLGRPYVREENSHKNNEVIIHTPSEYNTILSHRSTVCVGLTDMLEIKPRVYDYTKEGLLG